MLQIRFPHWPVSARSVEIFSLTCWSHIWTSSNSFERPLFYWYCSCFSGLNYIRDFRFLEFVRTVLCNSSTTVTFCFRNFFSSISSSWYFPFFYWPPELFLIDSQIELSENAQSWIRSQICLNLWHTSTLLCTITTFMFYTLGLRSISCYIVVCFLLF